MVELASDRELLSVAMTSCFLVENSCRCRVRSSRFINAMMDVRYKRTNHRCASQILWQVVAGTVVSSVKRDHRRRLGWTGRGETDKHSDLPRLLQFWEWRCSASLSPAFATEHASPSTCLNQALLCCGRGRDARKYSFEIPLRRDLEVCTLTMDFRRHYMLHAVRCQEALETLVSGCSTHPVATR